jgi:predicted nucleic acid-binding protein
MRPFLDTSVLSALFDERSPERKQLTEDFFRTIAEHEVCISDLTLQEIRLTPDESLRERMEHRCSEFAVLSGKEEETEELAEAYIKQGAVPSKHVEDAVHLAIAVVYGVDALLSWNFRHIVRRKTRNAVDLVSAQRNLRRVEIMTPAELL